MTGGISASTMAMMAATAAVSMQVAKASAKGAVAPIQAVSEAVKPPPTPQAAAAPDQQAARANASGPSGGGYGPGAGTTMLTGGVDPTSLSLGKNKLLGM